MIFQSPFENIDIPQTDLLSYLFPPNTSPSTRPIWIDAQDPSKNLSLAQLLTWVKRLGIGFDRLGIKHGEVVMIYTPNTIFVPVAYLGIVGNVRAFSAANPIYTVAEVVHQLKNTGARLILAHPSVVSNAVAAAKEAGLPHGSVYQISDEECREQLGVKDFRSFIGTEQEAKSYRWKTLSPEESRTTVATINYSSGTTGLPKGVCVSHANLIANVEQTIWVRRSKHAPKGSFPDEQRWIGFLPLYHAYGQLYANLMSAKLNIPVYIMKQFNFPEFLSHIQKYKITHLQVAPPILVMMSKRPEVKDYDVSSVQWILSGAAPLGKELQNEILRRFKMPTLQGWGMTEVTCGVLLNLEYSDDGNVGKILPNCEIKLVDDDGREVGYNEPGEIYVRGPNVMLRYWDNETATKDSLTPDGWLKTGDIAVVNEQQTFWIVDRKKELIKVNALQVSPAELEAILLTNDDVADAAVTGIQLHGEEWPRAYVALKDHAKGKVKEDDIAKWTSDRVAKYKRLVGGVMFVDEVPKLASGKIQRKVMREWSKRDAPALEKAGQVRERAKL